MELALTLFSLGLLGSVHCAGMCGGLVIVAAGNARARRALVTRQLQVLAGKAFTYACLGALAAASARAALEAATSYAGQRQSFGQTIINHQAVGFRLAQMATKVTAARQLTLHAAARVDAGEGAIAEASMAKAYATAIAEEVTSDAIQIHGGYGYLSDYPVERFYRDARVLSIYEGTNDIQHLVIARAIANGWSPRA